MTREETRKLLPIMKAYSEGETIQIWDESKSKWVDLDEASFSASPEKYRIKPEPKYRPFKNQEECWQEMQKHQPFGWIKDKADSHYSMVTTVDAAEGEKHISISGDYLCSLDVTMSLYTFADGTPFGIKEN